MSAAGAVDAVGESPDGRPDVETLIPIVRRIIRARVSDPSLADDLIQETLVRVLAKANRVAPAMLESYAIVTARNVVRSLWTERDRQRRNQHRVLELDGGDAPDEQLLKNVDAQAVSEALTKLSDRERATLLAHEVSGRDTRSLAADLSSTPGAVAAQLNTCWRSIGWNRRLIGVARCCCRCRRPIAVGRWRSVRHGTSWSARSAPP
jgi:RNA polymerase sigma factor (sigma-70 family)